jgi:hypothetical protein
VYANLDLEEFLRVLISDTDALVRHEADLERCDNV